MELMIVRGVLILILVAAAIVDLRTQKIPNVLNYSTMLYGLIANTVLLGLNGLVVSLEGLGLGLALLLLFYALGFMGAGDVKLMGALGSVLGPGDTLDSFLYIGLIGGVYALLVILSPGSPSRQFLKRYWLIIKTFLYTKQFSYFSPSQEERKVKLCYGVAISLGAICHIAFSHLGYASLPDLMSSIF